MTIAFADAPSEARGTVLASLKQRAGTKSLLTPSLRAAAPGDLDLKYAMRAVHLPVERIDLHHAPKPLHQLVEAPLWRFLVHTGKQAIAAAYAVEGDSPNWRIGEVAEDPTVEGTEVAVEAVARDAEFQAARYEPVLLQAPALDVIGLWLRAPQPEADMVVPIPPSTAPFAVYKAMPAKDFVERLYEKAEKIPRNDRARGG